MAAIASAIPITMIMPTIVQTLQSINNPQVPINPGTANADATSSPTVTAGSSVAAGASDAGGLSAFV
jgi:hypothetical protein